MADSKGKPWPLDLRLFAVASALWSVGLLLRVFLQGSLALPGDSFQAVLGGVKFYGLSGRLVMLLEAAIYMAIGAGALRQRRWALVLALSYMAQVLIGHFLFVFWYFGVPGQELHVRTATQTGPLVVLILLYLWIRSRDLLFDETRAL